MMPKRKCAKKFKPKYLESGLLRVDPKSRAFKNTLFKNLIKCAGAVNKALALCKIRKKDFYLALARDPKFKAEYERMRDYSIGIAEDEAIRRAVDGIEKPIFYKGEIVGHTREFSDYLLLKLLAIYRNNWRYSYGSETEVFPAPLKVDFRRRDPKESDIKPDTGKEET